MTNINADAAERFSLLDLDDGPRDRSVPHCPTCDYQFGENPSCPVCNAYRHAEARRLADPANETRQNNADAARRAVSAVVREQAPVATTPAPCACRSWAVIPDMFPNGEVPRGRQGVDWHNPSCENSPLHEAPAPAVSVTSTPQTRPNLADVVAAESKVPVSFSARTFPGSRSRRTRAWCRVVTGVTDGNGRGVKRLEGEYIADGTTVELDVDQVVIVVFHQGDEQTCRIFVVTPNGLRLHSEHDWRNYFDLVLTDVRDLLGQEQPTVVEESTEVARPGTIEADLVDIVEEGERIAGAGRRLVSRREVYRRGERERRIENAQQSSVGRTQLTAGNVVAGAAAEGNYIMVGFAGGGELTVPFVRDLLTGLNFDRSFFPEGKSDHYHAGKAVSRVNHSGCISRAVSKGRQRNGREWQSVVARWKVGSAHTEHRDSRFGDRLFYVDLMKNGELRFTYADANNVFAHEVAERVENEYKRCRAEETLRSTDVGDWLKSLLVNRWNGAKLGGNWVVPREHAAECERLLDAVSMHWGNDWMMPPIPIASGQAVAKGLARGFISDVNDLFTRLANQRAPMLERGSDLGPQAAATFLAKLMNIAERARTYAEVLGPDGLVEVRARARDLITELQPLASTAAQRAANIWDDLVASGEVDPY
jgi:hypothetical protein